MGEMTASPYSSRQSKDEQRLPCGDGYVLFAVNQKADRIGRHGTAGLKIPERLPRQGVEREEIAFVRPAENYAARGGQHAGPRRRLQTKLPFHLARQHIESANRAIGLVAVQHAFAAACEKCPWF